MARFRFKLEPVLKHRQIVEDQRQRELAQLLRQRMIFQDQLRQMQQTITQSKHDLAGGLTGTVNLDQIAQFTRYSAQVAQRAQSIVVRLAGMEMRIEAARQRLLDAAKARKALELLRDRYQEAWRREEERREALVLDELAVQSYGRQHAEVDSELEVRS